MPGPVLKMPEGFEREGLTRSTEVINKVTDCSVENRLKYGSGTEFGLYTGSHSINNHRSDSQKC